MNKRTVGQTKDSPFPGTENVYIFFSFDFGFDVDSEYEEVLQVQFYKKYFLNLKMFIIS